MKTTRKVVGEVQGETSNHRRCVNTETAGSEENLVHYIKGQYGGSGKKVYFSRNCRNERF